jgi:hypothetical protein
MTGAMSNPIKVEELEQKYVELEFRENDELKWSWVMLIDGKPLCSSGRKHDDITDAVDEVMRMKEALAKITGGKFFGTKGAGVVNFHDATKRGKA